MDKIARRLSVFNSLGAMIFLLIHVFCMPHRPLEKFFGDAISTGLVFFSIVLSIFVFLSSVIVLFIGNADQRISAIMPTFLCICYFGFWWMLYIYLV